MMRLLIVILTIAGIGCLVDASVQSPPSRAEGSETNAGAADDSVDPNASAAASITPHFVACTEGVCEPRTKCLADGGRAGAPCTSLPGFTCCHLD
jgi:hypothetical protein